MTASPMTDTAIQQLTPSCQNDTDTKENVR